MEAGKVNEFVDNLAIQDETVFYRGFLYYFYGIRFDEKKRIYYAMIDKFQDDIYHFEEPFYYHEEKTLGGCLARLLEDKIWDGRSFYEAEKEMTWADW